MIVDIRYLTILLIYALSVYPLEIGCFNGSKKPEVCILPASVTNRD